MRFPERSGLPLRAEARPIACVRSPGAWRPPARAGTSGREVVVVASARALRARCCRRSRLRLLRVPVALSAGARAGGHARRSSERRASSGDLAPAPWRPRGYAEHRRAGRPGHLRRARRHRWTCSPATSSFPVRLDFFGDELEEIRRIVPATGQTISGAAGLWSIYPVGGVPVLPAGAGPTRGAAAGAAGARRTRLLRDVLEKLDGGLRFDGADVVLPFLYAKPRARWAPTRGAGALRVPSWSRARCSTTCGPRRTTTAAGRARRAPSIARGRACSPSPAARGASGARGSAPPTCPSCGWAARVDDELPVKRVEVAGHARQAVRSG